MRLLILSCNTGEGHNSAARAVKEFFEDQNSVCEIKDALAYWSPEKSKLISKGHVFIYRRLPKLFGIGYRFEENHPPKEGNESLIYKLVIEGCDALYEDLSSSDYKAVICTHVFPAMMMTELRRRKNCYIPCYFIATDYTCSPGVGETMLDGYFIPHERLTGEFVACGIEESRIIPSGIPVRKEFYSPVSKRKAKEILGLPRDRRIVLMMCGSMGCGPIKSITECLEDLLPPDAMLVVICGSNRRLYKSLTSYVRRDNLRILGFTKQVSLYLDASDIVLTKPGGLSSTEAAIKALPMVFIDAVPGCETRNRDFFVDNGYAVMGNSVLSLCDIVCEYLKKPEKMYGLHLALKRDFNICAAQKIYEYISEEITLKYG